MELKDHHINGLRAAIEYVEAGLDDGASTLEGMAYYACMSPFHFDRIFKQATGIPPAEYLRLRRLSEASILISETKTQVAQVALKFGYSSQDAFGRAFKKHFCVTPAEIRKLGVLPYILQLRMSLADIPAGEECEKRTGIVEISEKKYTGLFRYGENKHNSNMLIDYDLFRNEAAKPFSDKFVFLDRINVASGLHEMFIGFEIPRDSFAPKGLQTLIVKQHKSVCVSYRGHADTKAEALCRGKIIDRIISEAKIRINDFVWKGTRSSPALKYPGWRIWNVEIPVIENVVL